MSGPNPDTIMEEDAPEPAVSVPESGDTGEGKLKMIIQLVKKCLGVKDIASMRLSLPASLLEPIPNLEYWHYLDRPDFFAAVNDSEDPFMRMLAVIRFTFTKDLKFVHGRVVKPYNSVLGEHFRAHWDVIPNVYTPDEPEKQEEIVVSETASFRSSKSITSGISSFSKPKSTSTAATSPPQNANDLAAEISNLNLASAGGEAIRVVYLTEQVSHHPPVSAYFASCPSRHAEMLGIDQISAKVSGTTIRVSPGQYNQGIFIRLTGGPGEGERYHITHPIASVNGILRGSFYITVGDSTIITCEGGKPGHKFRTIIEYKEESWLGKAHFLLEGVVHTAFDSDANYCAEWTKVKHVPHNRIVAVFDGSWKGKIRWRRVGTGSYPSHDHGGVTRSTASSPNPSHVKLPVAQIPMASWSRSDFVTSATTDEWITLLDVDNLNIIPKIVRPLERQHPRESRKLWRNVTDGLLKKEYSEATKEKVTIEQRQRDEAAERKKNGIEFVPRYFENQYDRGWAELTEDGKSAVEEELNEEVLCIEDVDPSGDLAD